MSAAAVRALFVDIGGVLATNGWDTDSRAAAVEHFALDARDVDSRHRMMFELFERGKISWQQYLDRVVFNVPRPFTADEFTRFVLARSRAYPEMIELVRALKNQYCLRVAAVSNEGRELTMHRVQKFDLREFIDFFISSCFVHLRKPDEEIFRLALDVDQVQPEQVIYVDDRPMFVQVARSLGIHGIIHTGYESTRRSLEGLGLVLSGGG